MSDLAARQLASGVMAATEKVVSQALSGSWHEVPRTLAQRRELLDQLRSQHTSANTAWLQALQQAVAESDAAVSTMAAASAEPATTATADSDALHLALRQSLLAGSGPGR
jgi:hypothetical protein